MTASRDEIKPPHMLDTLREMGAGLEMMKGLVSTVTGAILPRPMTVAGWPRVIVLPGFGTDDYSTVVLRRRLTAAGFKAEGWGLGRNRGSVPALVQAFLARLERRVAAFGGPIALVGQSLGGYIAREAARERPDLVSRIVTLGTPVKGGAKYTVLAGTYRRRGIDLDKADARIAQRELVPLKIPVTAFYSRHDGVVSWRACISTHEPMVRHVEIDATHCGMGFAPHMLERVVAELSTPLPR
ncbi:alpha/beta fold hydrolase [Oleomonas cavernae]|uniref:Alpha/beta fold hydrolase n=1 Tax=Oleomonas cavernae TaxID=2320859 RepID=A0A418WAP3_9PROT|nr:alpha/beta fold hydrolase [Oleomonas cavernae]RJF87049.1 alpha/beta fold hydrolase [Oleomonas cavernae]